MAAQDDVQLAFLTDGGQQPEDVANLLAHWLAQASTSLDIALYDCTLTDTTAATVASALNGCVDRGVSVRIAHYVGGHKLPVPPPPKGGSQNFLSGLRCEVRPVHGFQSLMHDKYVIRDGAAVWTGSTNWTNDSWSREENLIAQIASKDLAASYAQDFDQLWSTGQVENTGGQGSGQLQMGGQSVPARVWFSPSAGDDMATDVAGRIAAASSRIAVASPVLTVGNVLGALRDRLSQGGLSVRGVYDATQMAEVHSQWAGEQQSAWKSEAFEQIVQGAGFAGKHSTPYGPGSVHDYMHAKVMVVDDCAYFGSYNFSRSGQDNAENLVRVDSAALANQCADFIERLIGRYGGTGPAAV